jgi:hypothetical protein
MFWRRGILGTSACAVLMVGANAARAEPHHSGFTGDVGIGIAVTGQPMTASVSPCAGAEPQCAQYADYHWTVAKFGLAPLSFSLGGFLTPKVALLFRATGTSFSDYDGTERLNAFYGAVVEVWPHDRFFVGGGPGVGYYGTIPFQTNYNDSQATFALSARAGAALIGGRNHDLTLSLEGISGFYAEQTIFSGALIVAWKWY